MKSRNLKCNSAVFAGSDRARRERDERRETRDERRETRDETMAHLLRLNQLTTECNQIGKDADEIVATLFEVANLCKELEDEGKI